MMRRLCYALLTAVLLALIALFAVRQWGGPRPVLPSADAPAEIAGQSCEDGLRTARQWVRERSLDRARQAYLWLVEHCDDSPVSPDALLEAGSLLGHLMGRPREAQAAYAQFLSRFPNHGGAADATYHLAKLEIDAGDYASAAAHLTTLADRYPDSPHRESARFLAEKAAQMLAANRRAQRTVSGQLSALVPNNLVSVLALLLAMAPSVIQTVRQARRDAAGGSVRWPWIVPALVIGLTLLNSLINNVDNSRRNALVMEKLDRLLEARAQVPDNG